MDDAKAREKFGQMDVSTLFRVGFVHAHSRWESEWRATFCEYIFRTFEIFGPYQNDESAMRVALGRKASCCFRAVEVLNY